jgi:hypothetical protein
VQILPMACAKGDCTMQLTRIFVHAVAALMFGYSVYYDWYFVHIPKELSPASSGFGGKFKYLTFWDAVRLFAHIVLISVYFFLLTCLTTFASAVF